MRNVEISLTVNGEQVKSEVEPRTHLADFLREQLLLTGTHLGCEQGVCGACTVMVNGRPTRSCITLAAACDAADVRTVESFDEDPLMAKLRNAFTEHHGLQCGFCTPGLLATAYDIVRRVPDADNARIRKELSGNLCRCTGYQGAVNAIEHVVSNAPPAATLQPGPRTRTSVTATAPNSAISGQVQQTASSNTAELAVPDRVDHGEKLTRRVTIEAPIDQVWPVLANIESIAHCLPGAKVTSIDGSTAQGLMSVAIGPMRANFNGVADVQTNDAAKSGRVIGRGNDRLTRSSVDGAMTFQLADASPGQSELAIDVIYQLKGPLSQFGRPAIVAEVVDRLLAETTRNIAAKATGTQLSSTTVKPIGGLGLLWAALVGLFKSVFRR